MVAFIQKNFPYDLNQFPAERYSKDQCMLYLQEILLHCSQKKMTVQQLREGVENMYYLSYNFSTSDVSAFRVRAESFVISLKLLRTPTYL